MIRLHIYSYGILMFFGHFIVKKFNYNCSKYVLKYKRYKFANDCIQLHGCWLETWIHVSSIVAHRCKILGLILFINSKPCSRSSSRSGFWSIGSSHDPHFKSFRLSNNLWTKFPICSFELFLEQLHLTTIPNKFVDIFFKFSSVTSFSMLIWLERNSADYPHGFMRRAVFAFYKVIVFHYHTKFLFKVLV